MRVPCWPSLLTHVIPDLIRGARPVAKSTFQSELSYTLYDHVYTYALSFTQSLKIIKYYSNEYHCPEYILFPQSS